MSAAFISFKAAALILFIRFEKYLLVIMIRKSICLPLRRLSSERKVIDQFPNKCKHFCALKCEAVKLYEHGAFMQKNDTK